VRVGNRAKENSNDLALKIVDAWVDVVNWEAKPNDERDLRAVFVIGEVVAGIEVGARASRGVMVLLLTLLALGQSAHV
jgi:hypothetical protein